MSSYPVDIDPEQVVRWLIVERQRGTSDLEITVRRSNETQPIQPRAKDRLGDAEREDLHDEATVARLEVSPVHASKGWRLVIEVEGEPQSLEPEEEFEEDGEEPIDLDTFYLQYMRSGHGTARISAETEGPAAEVQLSELLQAIGTDAHVPEFQRLMAGKIKASSSRPRFRRQRPSR